MAAGSRSDPERTGNPSCGEAETGIGQRAKSLFSYALAKDILGERNSFSKTDPDATMMHMKYDYYNHTNVFKPGYNVQIGVNNGYIAYSYISPMSMIQRPQSPFWKDTEINSETIRKWW